MPTRIFVPESQAVTESRSRLVGGFVTRTWLAFFTQIADLLNRISRTGTAQGVVVTDDDGVAQVVLNEMDTPAFSAGAFTADAGSWTVGAADVVTYAFARLGRMMTVAFTLQNTTVAGGPAVLRIVIPESRTAAKTISNPVVIVDDGDPEIGEARVTAAGDLIEITRIDGSTFSAATDSTGVRGEITFELNPE